MTTVTAMKQKKPAEAGFFFSTRLNALQSGRMFEACFPLGPVVTSNSTF